MKRSTSLATALLVSLAACSQPEVVIEAAVPPTAGAAPGPVAGLPVRLLPYDRDAIIDSLTKEYGKPEPSIPPDLAAQRDSLRALEAVWRQASGAQAGRLDGGPTGVKPPSPELRSRIEALRRTVEARLDSLRSERQRWAAAALEGFDEVARRRSEREDRSEVADTTDAAGAATFHVDEGRWWVYARYALPDEELYWNFPVEIKEKSTRVRLEEANAKKRPVM